MDNKNAKIIEKILTGEKVILASSRIKLTWFSTIIMCMALIALFGLFAFGLIKSGDFKELYVPLGMITVLILIILFVLKLSSFKIENHTITMINGYGKSNFKPDQIESTSSFSLALWDPFRLSYYTKIRFKTAGTTKTYFVLNNSKMSADHIAHPDMLINKIKYSYLNKDKESADADS